MKTQSDKNLNFNGMAGDGVNRAANRFSGNQWSGHSNDGRLVNKGRGPTKGNQDHKAMQVGKPATKDAYRAVPECHTPSVSPGRDMFTGKSQYRGEGGTQVKGFKNPDRINVSGYDMGDGKMNKGSRPVAAGSTEGINYGPKKQY